VRIGYARVSTQDQRLDVQHEALTRSGCDRVFDDTISGKVAGRPGLQKALDILREGDRLVGPVSTVVTASPQLYAAAP